MYLSHPVRFTCHGVIYDEPIPNVLDTESLPSEYNL